MACLPVLSMLTATRVSKRFHALAGDSELWKRRYFAQWVLPRARAVPQSRHLKLSSTGTAYSPRVSKWLGHSHLAEDDTSIHWKTQYRLRHNWSKGTCRLDELEVSRPPLPQILIKLYSGVVITADREHGLRAWSTKRPKKQLTGLTFPTENDIPTALHVAKGSPASSIEVTVGFDDGHFSVYNLDVIRGEFTIRFSQESTSDATITAIASAPPYFLTISDHKVFNLYKVLSHVTQSGRPAPDQLRLLASLESNNTFAPMSLSLRCSASEVIASIAYSFFHISNGWTIGIQELRFNKDGEHITSRLATTVAVQPKADEDGHDDPSTDGKPNNNHHNRGDVSLSTASIQHKEAPTSLSYSHPFLLTSHSDNTLTMYLVFSSADKLVIRDSRRLWGHTSSVSSVQVGDRGKAVSVSPRGNEIRIWELESAVSSSSSPLSSRSRSIQGESSVQINYEKPSCAPSVSLGTTSGAMDWSRQVSYQRDLDVLAEEPDGWIGFDDEQVVVLRQRGLRAQFLECYDFT